jgi:hypothetical protein
MQIGHRDSAPNQQTTPPTVIQSQGFSIFPSDPIKVDMSYLPLKERCNWLALRPISSARSDIDGKPDSP